MATASLCTATDVRGGDPYSWYGAVAHTRLGAEVLGSGPTALDLPSHPGHEHPEVLGLCLVLRSPYLVEQLLMRDEPAGIADEHFDDVPLLRCEVDIRPVLHGLLGGQVDRERLCLDPRILL